MELRHERDRAALAERRLDGVERLAGTSEGEQRTSAGQDPLRRMYLAMLFEARSPRGASGRSMSASVGSDQLDFPWRSRMMVRTGRPCLQRLFASSSPRQGAAPRRETSSVTRTGSRRELLRRRRNPHVSDRRGNASRGPEPSVAFEGVGYRHTSFLLRVRARAREGSRGAGPRDGPEIRPRRPSASRGGGCTAPLREDERSGRREAAGTCPKCLD